MIPHFAEYGVIFIFFRRKVFLKTDGGKTGKHLVKEVKRDLQQVGFRSADRAGVMDVTGIHQKDIACVQQEGKYVIIRICPQLYFSDTLFS